MKAILAAAALIAITFAPSAHADDSLEDSTFLKAIHDHGIDAAHGDLGLVRNAHVVCDMLDGGSTASQAQGVLTQHGLSSSDAPFFVSEAIYVYCPWNQNK
jgi:Protein of unknown function (DUF732)